MRPTHILTVLAGLTLLSGPALAVDGSDIAGDYGDANGRLGCAADGEYLEFTADGKVQLWEDGASQTVATYEVIDGLAVALDLADPPGHRIDLSIEGDRLAIVGYSVDGQPDPAELETWSHRHGAFVPCRD